MPNKHTTLADLFTATADAIRFKTGSTGVIVADNFPEAIRAMNVGAGSNEVDITSMNVLNLTLPMGRVKGDLDGDGKITHHNVQETEVDLSTDSGILFSYNSDADIELNEIQQWCADTNSDDEINNMDSSYLFGHASGVRNMFCDSIDAGVNPEYYNNWTFMKVDSLNGYFYHDIEVPGMTADSVALLAVSDNFEIFDGVECMDGVARIKAKMPPIEPMEGFLVWDQNGDSGNAGELRFCSGTLPLGRVKGDIDGDGIITEEDHQSVLKHMVGNEVITDEISLWCAEVTHEGDISSRDATKIQLYIEGTENIFCAAVDAGVNPDYYNNWNYYKIDDLNGYFYYDIPNPKVTSNSSAILIASSHEDCFDGVECFDGKLRVKANIPPIEPVDFNIIYSVYRPNGVVTTLATLPRGRMLGDIDGDGIINSTDYDLLFQHLSGTEGAQITDEVALWCADIKQDSSVDGLDITRLDKHIKGTANLFCTSVNDGVNPEYYNNWSYVKVDDLEGYFYYDIFVSGMKTDYSANLLVEDCDNLFIGVECLEDTVRVKAKYCPIKDINAIVVWDADNKNDYSSVCPVKTTEFTVPKGRMLGDINGDGEVTSEDYNIAMTYLAGDESVIIDEVGLWCLDAYVDEKYDSKDFMIIGQHIEGEINLFNQAKEQGASAIDYYNNWRYEPIDALTGYFYYEVQIAGAVPGRKAFLFVSSNVDCFDGVECFDGLIRIKANKLPLEDVVCNVALGPVGSTLVDDGFETVYTDIPMGRMLGDIDGDGLITQEDYSLALEIGTNISEPSDEIAQWCADINGDEVINSLDSMLILQHVENENTENLRNIFCDAIDNNLIVDYYNNWSYEKIDALNGYFYYDIPFEGMTTSSTAVLLASDYADCFEGIECMDGVARIKATRCPIGGCIGTILWKQCEKVKSELVIPLESLELISLEDIDAICSVM